MEVSHNGVQYPPVPQLPEVKPPTTKQIRESQAKKVPVDKFKIKAPRRYQVIDKDGVRFLNLRNLQQCIDFRNAMVIDHDKAKDLLPHESTMYSKFVKTLQEQGQASQPRYPSKFKYQLHQENQQVDLNLRAIKEIITKPDDFFNKTSYKQTVKAMKKQMAFFEHANPFKQKSDPVEEVKRPDIGSIFAKSMSLQKLGTARLRKKDETDSKMLPDLDSSRISQLSVPESLARFEEEDAGAGVESGFVATSIKKPKYLSNMLSSADIDKRSAQDEFPGPETRPFSIREKQSHRNTRDYYWQTLTGKSDRSKLSRSDATVSRPRFSNQDLSARVTIREVGRPILPKKLNYTAQTERSGLRKMKLPKDLLEAAQSYNDYYCTVDGTLMKLLQEFPEVELSDDRDVEDSPKPHSSPNWESLRNRVEQLRSVKKGTQDYLMMLHRSDVRKETLRRSELTLTRVQEHMDNHNRRLFEKNLVIMEDDEQNEDRQDMMEPSFAPRVTFEATDMKSDSSATWMNHGKTTYAVMGSTKIVRPGQAWVKEGAGHGSQKRMIIKPRPNNPPPEPSSQATVLKPLKKRLIHDPLRKIFHKLPYFKKGVYHSVWMDMIDELLLEEDIFDSSIKVKPALLPDDISRPEIKRQQSTILSPEKETPESVNIEVKLSQLEASEVSRAIPLSNIGYYKYVQSDTIEVQGSPDPLERALIFVGQFRSRIKTDLTTDREKFFDNYCTLCSKFVQASSTR